MSAAEGFGPQARYALYYAPPAASAWWGEGCRWLQRDAQTGASLLAPVVPGLSRPLDQLTAKARQYGWHATLVAPFRCAPGVNAEQVLATAQAWAERQHALQLAVRVAALDGFMAIVPAASGVPEEAGALKALNRLAADAVRTFQPLRAAPTAAELDKRRAMQLSARQDALLQDWGYPFVFDEFRFHMTLSDRIGAADADAMLAWWHTRLPALGPLPLEGAALYVQAVPDAALTLWQRLSFAPGAPA